MFAPSILSYDFLPLLLPTVEIGMPLWERPFLRGGVIVQGGAGRTGAVILCGSGAVWFLWLLCAVYLGEAPLVRG